MRPARFSRCPKQAGGGDSEGAATHSGTMAPRLFPGEEVGVQVALSGRSCQEPSGLPGQAPHVPCYLTSHCPTRAAITAVSLDKGPPSEPRPPPASCGLVWCHPALPYPQAPPQKLHNTSCTPYRLQGSRRPLASESYSAS